MHNITFEDGKVTFSRSEQERLPLVHALSRVEGQVQGIRRMIEQDRYCGDELQQLKAAISALKAVAKTIAGQHIEAALLRASGEAGQEEMGDVHAILARVLSI